MAQGYHAEFVEGAVSPRQFPAESLPEVAFVGRSNVGKSSLLNRLVNQRKMARVSRTPGCTRQINFFRVGGRWWFVDLPGYGFARVDRERKETWQRGIGGYLSARRDLRTVVLLLDCRQGLTALDREMVDYLTARGLPFRPVATKIDKLKRSQRRRALGDLEQAVAAVGGWSLGPPLACSALNGEGIDELRDWLATLLESPGQEESPAR